MEIKDINKLKVGDKIFISVYDIDTNKRFEGTRIVRQVLNHNDSKTHGYPHLSVNRIVVKCFNKLYQLSSWQIWKTKTAYKKRGGGMTTQKSREPSGYYCEL